MNRISFGGFSISKYIHTLPERLIGDIGYSLF